MKNLFNYKSIFKILSKGRVGLLVSAFLAGISTQAIASPTGANVTSGSSTISQSGSITNINQTTQKATINWQNFSIAANETVNFNQPNVSSITLNRVVGNERSIIDGALNANGQVWILNSNGILFNSTARINTAGILATTKDISDADFNAGNYKFKGDSSASIINLGAIEASDSGYVALLANTVQNDGTIKAYRGTVNLTGASEATINLNGNSIVSLTVDKGVLDALVENKNIIQADGGKVYLTTNAVDEILKGVVNNTGIIEAKSLDDVSSEVILFAHGGTANISGSIIADGGFVETSGDKVKINDEFKVKAEEWLIDPVDFTIAASGGDMTGATLSSNLANTDVTIQSSNGGVGINGDIFVNTTVSWDSDKDLTLSAYRNIYINSAITATSGGKLALYYGQGAPNASNTSSYYVNAKVNISAGDNFFTKLGSDGVEKTYKVITSLGIAGSTTGTDLQGINGNLSGNYVLGANIDASGTSIWNSGAGFSPIFGITYVYDPMMAMMNPSMAYREEKVYFSGIFDGLGHTISNMTINRPSSNDEVGLFAATTINATLKNIGITNGNFTGKYGVGPLAGFNGGLISNAYSDSTVSGSAGFIGGLVGGQNYGSAIIENSYATGNVSGDYYVGGLVGMINGTVRNSYATGAVAGTSDVGGLMGWNGAGTIQNSYSTGSVSGTSDVGGLVGGDYLGAIQNSYSTGVVSGSTYTGGMIGKIIPGYGPTISNSFWDTQTSGQSASAGGTGKTTAEFANASTFNGWDTDVWSLSSAGASGEGYEIAFVRPYLTSLGKDVALQTSTTLFAGGYGTSASPYTITTAAQLQNMNNSNVVSQSYYYNLSNNLDLTDVTWTPIGNSTTKFTGTFDGLNHTIDRLVINRLSTDNIGLFGYTNNATIKNIGITNADIKGGGEVGTIIGRSTNSSLLNSYASGVLVGNGGADIGGLVGYNENSSVDGSNSSVAVTGTISVGGLVGSSHGAISNSYSTGNVLSSGFNTGGFIGYNQGTITNAYATGTVGSTADKIGGFVGINNAGGNISLSYATGAVTASNSSNIGGFAGANISSTISGSYARGSVIGDTFVGGLVGRNEHTISNSYSAGSVSGTQYIGGLTGANLGTISNSYATGSVSGSSDFGGLSGYNNYAVLNSFWNTETSGQASSAGGTGKTTSEMKTLSTFSTWGTDIVLDSSLTDVYPQLRWATTGVNAGTSVWVIGSAPTIPIYLRLISGSSVYGETPSLLYGLYDASSGGTLITNASDTGTVTWSGAPTFTSNVGTYSLTYDGGISLGNNTYTLNSGASGSWVINQRPITLTADSVSKTYGDPETALSATISNSAGLGLASGDTLADITGTLTRQSGENVGSYDVVLGTSNKTSNYNISFTADNDAYLITQKNSLVQIDMKQTQIFGIPVDISGLLSDELLAQGTQIKVYDTRNNDVTSLALQGKAIPGRYIVSAVNDNLNCNLTSNDFTLTITPAIDPATLYKPQVALNNPSPQNSVTNIEASNITPQNNITNIGTQDIGSATVVSTVVEGQPNQKVTLSELKQSQTSQESSNNEVKDVKIALSETSLVSIVNGGINLPSGVDQEFYVVRTNSQAAGAN